MKGLTMLCTVLFLSSFTGLFAQQKKASNQKVEYKKKHVSKKGKHHKHKYKSKPHVWVMPVMGGRKEFA